MYLLRFGEVAFYLGYNAMKNFFPMTQVALRHPLYFCAFSHLLRSQQKANPTCSSAWCVRQQAQFAEWAAKQVRSAFAHRNLELFYYNSLYTLSSANNYMQPAPRCEVATVLQAAPVAANEWGITLEDSSIDDPTAASGGAALPEGLFYAFERSAQTSIACAISGGALAGAKESVDDLMAQLQGL
jgi:hypothetical protein